MILNLKLTEEAKYSIDSVKEKKKIMTMDNLLIGQCPHRNSINGVSMGVRPLVQRESILIQ